MSRNYADVVTRPVEQRGRTKSLAEKNWQGIDGKFAADANTKFVNMLCIDRTA